MARALTAPELAHLRDDYQHSLLYLAVHLPGSVYTARLNGLPSSDDRVATITYDARCGDACKCNSGYDCLRWQHGGGL